MHGGSLPLPSPSPPSKKKERGFCSWANKKRSWTSNHSFSPLSPPFLPLFDRLWQCLTSWPWAQRQSERQSKRQTFNSFFSSPKTGKDLMREIMVNLFMVFCLCVSLSPRSWLPFPPAGRSNFFFFCSYTYVCAYVPNQQRVLNKFQLTNLLTSADLPLQFSTEHERNTYARCTYWASILHPTLVGRVRAVRTGTGRPRKKRNPDTQLVLYFIQ